MNANRVALITGSSRGIGQGIAERLAADNFAVVINYANSREAADALVTKLTRQGSQAIAVRANIASRDDRLSLIEQTYQQWGRLDLLVNNAGITSPGRQDLLQATEESWDAVFSTNLKGPFFLSQLAAKRMIPQIQNAQLTNANIINISSISAFAVSTNRADYCIAKKAMQMMTWQFAVRLAEEGINVYEVCPGVIESDMTAPVREKYDKLIADGLSPIRRWGTPTDVAAAVSAIANEHFPFSTGERIHVDGGYHLRRL